MELNDWHLLRIGVALAAAFLIVTFTVWAERKARDWGKKRFGESSRAYRLLFASPFGAIRPFSLSDRFSRQQADLLYRIPLFIFLTLPFFPPNMPPQTREAVVTVVSLFATASVLYFFSWRKNFKPDPNYKPRFSLFRFLAENKAWSRETADRTFLRAMPMFIALMCAFVPIQRMVLGQETADFAVIANILCLPFVGLVSLLYLFRHRKRFTPEGATTDSSPLAFARDPQFRRSIVYGLVRTALPVLVFISLIAIFVPDDPNNPLARFTFQTVYWAAFVFVISLPSILIHSWARNTLFGSRHRFLVAFLSWLVPPTLMYIARSPMGMRRDLELAPTISSIWFFTAFVGAAVLAHALMSGKAPKSNLMADSLSREVSVYRVSE